MPPPIENAARSARPPTRRRPRAKNPRHKKRYQKNFKQPPHHPPRPHTPGCPNYSIVTKKPSPPPPPDIQQSQQKQKPAAKQPPTKQRLTLKKFCHTEHKIFVQLVGVSLQTKHAPRETTKDYTPNLVYYALRFLLVNRDILKPHFRSKPFRNNFAQLIHQF